MFRRTLPYRNLSAFRWRRNRDRIWNIQCTSTVKMVINQLMDDVKMAFNFFDGKTLFYVKHPIKLVVCRTKDFFCRCHRHRHCFAMLCYSCSCSSIWIYSISFMIIIVAIILSFEFWLFTFVTNVDDVEAFWKSCTSIKSQKYHGLPRSKSVHYQINTHSCSLYIVYSSAERLTMTTQLDSFKFNED